MTGDTKVVEKAKGDGFTSTPRVLVLYLKAFTFSGANCKPGDVIAVSGDIGDHGIAIMSQRANLGFETEIQSDSASLNSAAEALVKEIRFFLRCMRDPTRGGSWYHT